MPRATETLSGFGRRARPPPARVKRMPATAWRGEMSAPRAPVQPASRDEFVFGAVILSGS